MVWVTQNTATCTITYLFWQSRLIHLVEEVTVCRQSAIGKVITRKNKEYSKSICELKKCVLCMPVFPASISEGVDHEPANMDIFQPANVDIFQPANVDIFQPANVDIFQPANVDIFQPANVDIFQPANVDIFQPANVDIFQPANMNIFQPVNVDISEPVSRSTAAAALK